MTGGGLGGCVIALVATSKVDVVGDAVRRAAGGSGHPEPTITRTHAGRDRSTSELVGGGPGQGLICSGLADTWLPSLVFDL